MKKLFFGKNKKQEKFFFKYLLKQFKYRKTFEKIININIIFVIYISLIILNLHQTR